ncbi:MAG: transcription-repair coupling factor [Bacteroidales bacterium]|nr:transcription-repair coupling factor [Lentimicrobiaceae bacterium]MDD5693723.1 transcription-repair coupling factor [Bacteroidales bacterium]
MDLKEIQALYAQDARVQQVRDILLENHPGCRLHIKGLLGSSRAFFSSSLFHFLNVNHLFILPDKESAAYFYNDLENLFGERNSNYTKKKILFFPTSYKRHYQIEDTDNTNLLSRSEVLSRLGTEDRKSMIVTYPEALSEKVITRNTLRKNLFKIKKGDALSLDFIGDLLSEYEFERVDFVLEPGHFSIRGGIVDVFSFSNDNPFRLEFAGDEIASIRTFDPGTQLSLEKLNRITLLPNIQDRKQKEQRESLLAYIQSETVLWFDQIPFTLERIDQEFHKAEDAFLKSTDTPDLSLNDLFTTGKEILKDALSFPVIELGNSSLLENSLRIECHLSPQPSFNKNFNLLLDNLRMNSREQVYNIITTDSPKQLERLYAIFEDIQRDLPESEHIVFTTLNLGLQGGFVDHDLKIAIYTDHQIFDRYHRFELKEFYSGREALTIKELYNLNPGDYVTHIDHGIGRYEGLEKIENNGRIQEAIRIVYDNDDLLYVSIHSLHRISKYIGKEGSVPKLNRLGSNAWNRIKERTKQKVKDIAKDLIKLYAERKTADGYPFSPDSYLQHELEASFIYEDTPDQVKSTNDIKGDMEATHPMDRLICGDVGFGKTEVAIRAAFKAVADSKQVALLVPTTILAFQHYRTFSDRLRDFPCTVDYINRFKSPKELKKSLSELESGKTDILIGTHRLLSKDVVFKDLGLLIVDEEQKFGVSAKERLKQLKVNVDTLTLTATPIPRTLQFSLMGARDLSVINTPPPNRYPIQTEIHPFGEDIIRNAIRYELSRGGQVYFVHNRIQNIQDVAQMISKFVPGVKIAVGHGQMEGHKLERTMLDFIEGYYDILLSTTIIENGLDIPNVNTIIINDAQNYGLSDLHQLRGRVGRSNKKAFCYLLSPPLSVLTPEARKRLKAIEEFAELGSGFNIALRDLDIRGAGNLLGAEQSGFITEIGFEMYHKILDEALQELRETEFRELYKAEAAEEFIREVQLETDLGLLIPDDYVSNISERLILYKELDNVDNEEWLMKYLERMIDRFGPIPAQVDGLIHAVRLRWIARKAGFEKIILKNNCLVGQFVSNQESDYYKSDLFASVLDFVKNNPLSCRLKEKQSRLTLTIEPVRSVFEALEFLRKIASE